MSQNTTVQCVNFIIRLTKYFGPSARPSSGHKIYKDEEQYRVSHKIYSKIRRSLVVNLKIVKLQRERERERERGGECKANDIHS